MVTPPLGVEARDVDAVDLDAARARPGPRPQGLDELGVIVTQSSEYRYRLTAMPTVAAIRTMVLSQQCIALVRHPSRPSRRRREAPARTGLEQRLDGLPQAGARRASLKSTARSERRSRRNARFFSASVAPRDCQANVLDCTEPSTAPRRPDNEDAQAPGLAVAGGRRRRPWRRPGVDERRDLRRGVARHVPEADGIAPPDLDGVAVVLVLGRADEMEAVAHLGADALAVSSSRES